MCLSYMLMDSQAEGQVRKDDNCEGGKPKGGFMLFGLTTFATTPFALPSGEGVTSA